MADALTGPPGAGFDPADRPRSLDTHDVIDSQGRWIDTIRVSLADALDCAGKLALGVAPLKVVNDSQTSAYTTALTSLRTHIAQAMADVATINGL